MPDCHGSEKSRFGSHFGCSRFETRFFSFGMFLLSFGTTQPALTQREAIQSVSTTRSRPSESPAWSCWRTFPKNSSLSLISSVYFTFEPGYFFSKSLSTDLSM